uniref:beta-mannosidase n=1 Tax=Arcella intermedia TaxID=1963864 RepID=A0A6B2KY47_9EUKA
MQEKGIVSNPYLYNEELQQRWIAERDWRWSTLFNIKKEHLDNYRHFAVVAEGIDTVANITVNSKLIGKTKNQHVQHVFEIPTSLLTLGDNQISIQITSPLNYCQKKADKDPYDVPCMIYMNGGKHWNQIRKRGCSFGWDWGPCFPTMGIFKNIYLSCYLFRVSEWVVRSSVSVDLERGSVELEVRFEGDLVPSEGNIQISHEGVVIYNENVNVSLKHFKKAILVEKPKLWFPLHYGTPNVYLLKFKVENFEQTKQFGFRKVELVREKDQAPKYGKIGESFYFKINNVPIFSKGANWIPPDCFSNRVKWESVKGLLDSVKKANMNTIRIWGGGDYESEEFFNYCDQNGIMVWQDLMFACSFYPTSPSFLKNVSVEISQKIHQLISHPSLLVICGNNENEEALYKDWFKSDEKKSLGKAPLISDYQKLFIDTIYPIVAREASLNGEQLVPFWPSSPSNGIDKWMNPALTESGDSHCWGIWHGSQGFQEYLKIHPRFCSEFGFQSFPSPATLREVFQSPESWNLSSLDLEFRQRSPKKGNLFIIEHLLREFFYPKTFEQLLYVSQVLQALSIKTAIEHWRRLKPYCMGVIYWQLNDIWPGTSWSSIEYNGHWKVLHYFVKNAFQPVLVSLAEDDKKLSLHVTSDVGAMDIKIEISLWDIRLNERISDWKVDLHNFTGNAIVWENLIPALLGNHPTNTSLLAVQCWHHFNGEMISTTNYHIFNKYKELQLPTPNISFKTSTEGQETLLEVLSDHFSFFTWITTDLPGHFSDNAFLLFPNKPKTITFTPSQQPLPQQPKFHITNLKSTY